jgi:hypothetical protein
MTPQGFGRRRLNAQEKVLFACSQQSWLGVEQINRRAQQHHASLLDRGSKAVAMRENAYRGLSRFIKASSKKVAMTKTQQSSSAVSD